MKTIGRPEKDTQERVIRVFTDELKYRYLGNKTNQDNSNIEVDIVTAFLSGRGYSEAQVSQAVHKLQTEAQNYSRDLYENNQNVYKLLRYGVDVKVDAEAKTETIQLIEWNDPTQNDFAIAEEVTLKGNNERRPDLVLYVNGIAFGVIELKNSFTSIGEGIRQLRSNQRPEFNAWFFSTVQIVFAGNNSEGLKYGTIGTPEKKYLSWKEDVTDDSRLKLDKYLLKMCEPARILEILHDFVLFDAGAKKLPRVHQYFGIKAAQEYVRQKKGGIIWHTQGSGKSIVMVLLAKWILENNPNARVVVVTDRDELDEQIERVFLAAGESIKRATSGRDLMSQLSQTLPRMVCSLVHKFGRRDVDDIDAFIEELESSPCQTFGELFVFVDECHRTQSGKLHRLMKAIMPNAVFIGFTGTPLLKKDKATSREVFGEYIHTYKFKEAVEDGVVLDLVYEARDIDQWLTSEEEIDKWFDEKTDGLNKWQKNVLIKRWATMQAVLSARSRMDRIVADIATDFDKKPRLSDGRGNAILVASSIYEACRYFTLLQQTPLKGYCAIITSYNPQAQDISKEDTGATTETDKQFVYRTYVDLLTDVSAEPVRTQSETYEKQAKREFINSPAQMKLLVVVDKLLTGFDAPSCTYLYIDKSMQDHGLFQAICRTNRLDGPDKMFGYIVDYCDLFEKLVNEEGSGAIQVYSSDLDHSTGKSDILLQDRLESGRIKLDSALEALDLLCEPVPLPNNADEIELVHIRYFCGNSEIPTDLEERAALRTTLYSLVADLMRAYANIADDFVRAGYSNEQVVSIQQKCDDYLALRMLIQTAANERLDVKPYEADMRHLIDTYIEAEEPRKISPLDNVGVLDLIVTTGIINAVKELPKSLGRNPKAVPELIEGNVRDKIKKYLNTDPAFFDKMSKLLDEIIQFRKEAADEYEEYLKRISDLTNMVTAGRMETTPSSLDTAGKIALANNLGQNEKLALSVDEAVRNAKPDGWRDVLPREQIVKRALYDVLHDAEKVESIFQIIKEQKEY